VALIVWVVARKPQSGSATSGRSIPAQFASNLDGVTFNVDGTNLQGTSAELAPGPHKLLATKLGYRPVERQFTLTAESSRIDVKLDPEPSAIRVSADVPSGKVLLDGKP